MTTTQTARTAAPAPKKPRGVVNGVDVDTLFATLDAVKGQPGLAQFQFRAQSRWIDGTHSRTRSGGYFGAGSEHEHKRVYETDGDHPPVLCGTDEGPTPVEYLLHALAACITAGIGNIAAARGVKLTEVTSTLEGDIDLRGILGLSDEVRNGYSGIRATFKIKGDAPREKLEAIVAQSQSRSAVFDVLTRGVPVDVSVEVG